MSNLTLEEIYIDLTNSVITISVIIGLEAVIGLIGNLLIIIVYSGQHRQGNFHYFVLAQAAIDLISCVTTLPGEIVSQMYWYRYEFNTVCKIKSFFNVFTVWGSASTLTVMSFDRFWKITHPLSKQITRTLALRCCIIVLIIAVLVSIPAGFLWGKQTYTYTYQGQQVNVSICEKDDKYSHESYHLIYLVCVYIGPVGLMIFLMTTLNILTAVRLFRNQKFEKNMDGVGSGSPPCSPLEADMCNGNTLSNYEGPDTVKNGCHIHLAHLKHQRSISIPSSVDNDRHHTANVFCCTGTSESANSKNVDEISRHSSKRKAGRPLCLYTNVRFHRGKTVTMFILTTVFTTTTLVYIILSSLIASEECILRHQSNTNIAVIFLFWRLYFVNCVIDPVIYGIMDPRFRAGLKSLFRRQTQTATEV